MKKVYCLIANVILLAWFFMDMTGVYFENNYLVTRSWREDGIYFIIFLIALLLFLLKENIGKYVLIIWQALWLLTQFISHEWFSIFGGGEGKIRYFEGAIKLVNSDSRYIPDAYHTVLHALIIIALITTITYSIKSKKAYD